MIQLVFDTSALLAAPYYARAEFSTLKSFVDEGYLKVNLSTIVKREYLENLKKDCSDKFGCLNRSLGKINRSYFINSSDIDNFMEAISRIEEEAIEGIEGDFYSSFLCKFEINILEIKPDHPDEVFDKYFKGQEPFKSTKSRGDLPDAFIFESILSLANEYGQDSVVALVKDKSLSDACSKAGIKVFGSLEDFIKSEDVTRIINKRELEHEGSKKRDFLSYLCENKFIESFFYEKHVDELENITIESPKIPSDCNTAIVTGLYFPEDIDSNYDALIPYGDNKFGVPVTFKILVSATFFIFKADYYSGHYSFGVTDWNNHYFNAEAEFLLKVECTVFVDASNIDFKQEVIDFGKYIDDVELRINNIEKIEVISALQEFES